MRDAARRCSSRSPPRRGGGRRAALFDNQPWHHVAKAASAILADASRAPCVHGDLSLPRLLLAAIARGKAVAPAPQSSHGYGYGRSPPSPVLEVPRDALVNAVLALRAVERRGALAEANAAQSALDSSRPSSRGRRRSTRPGRSCRPSRSSLRPTAPGAAGRDSAPGSSTRWASRRCAAAGRRRRSGKMSVKLATHGS